MSLLTIMHREPYNCTILYLSKYFGIAVLKILEKYLKYLNTSINWISFKEGKIMN